MKKHELAAQLEAEIARNSGNEMLAELGRLFIAHISAGDPDAEISADGKTLSGAIGRLRNYASKHQTGNMGVVTPEKAVKICEEHFGVGNLAGTKGAPGLSAARPAAESDTGVSLNLLDFM